MSSPPPSQSFSMPPRLPPKGNNNSNISTGSPSPPPLPQLVAQQPSSTQGFQLEPITIPNYLESLPIKHLKELTQSHELMKDYLVNLNNNKICDYEEKVIKQIDNNIALLNELQLLLDTTIIPKQHSLEKELEQLDQKFKQIWSKQELKMYGLLDKYSTENLTRMMNCLILEVDDYTKTLYQSLISGDEKFLSDGEIIKFIDEYTENRQLYHLRKEKYYRLRESRVSG